MAELLDDTNTLINTVNTNISDILEAIGEFNKVFDSNYMLQLIRDGEYLKTLMKEKIELGIKDYDY